MGQGGPRRRHQAGVKRKAYTHRAARRRDHRTIRPGIRAARSISFSFHAVKPRKPSLFAAMALIIGGITLGIVADGRLIQAAAPVRP
ncbi:hypothetical protein [Bradyrhizobium sp. AZCC 2289]|uniref:hypothetical protein n=1 Tax=Bradyrhizobium sp. AZCC 2289 TaxID=3117026 RepID=UPI002FF377EA